MKIEENADLKKYNSFGVKATAKKLAIISSARDFADVLPLLQKTKKSMILGAGSNVLFTKDFDGLILLNRITGKKVIAENKTEVYLHVQGGENWSELVDYTVERGWGGLENLSLIPGTAGAAPVQNIGAYGLELNEVLITVEAFDLSNGNLVRFSNQECNFSYRSSIFKTTHKGNYFILSILLRLTKKPVFNLTYQPLKARFSNIDRKIITVKQISEAVKEIRRSKLPDPEEIGNAGSFFKNPVVPFSKVEELVKQYPEIPFYKTEDEKYKLAAGWLIEKVGWKGKRIGDAGVHKKQALVLVNYGNATGMEIYKLSKRIQSGVKEHFGIELEREVTVI